MNDHNNNNNHPCHSKELIRLKKISGQINGIIKMIEEKRYCPDILQQVNAVKSAINSVQANILETHLQNCVTESFKIKDEKEVSKKIEELKDIFKKYI